MKVLQKVPDVHRMLIDFRKKQAKIVFGRFLGLLFVPFMGVRNFFYVEGKERKDAQVIKKIGSGYVLSDFIVRSGSLRKR